MCARRQGSTEHGAAAQAGTGVLATALAVLAVVVATARCRLDWWIARSGATAEDAPALDAAGDGADARPLGGRPAPWREGGRLGAARARGGRAPWLAAGWPRSTAGSKVASSIRGYAGHFITDSEWRVVSSDTARAGGVSRALFATDATFTSRLRAEGAALTRPLPSLGPRLDAKGIVRVGAPTQFVCAWVAPAGSPGGALCFRVDPLSTFNVALAGGQVGATGEAYAIDRQGRLRLAQPLRGGAGRGRPARARRLVDLQRAGARARGAPVPRPPPPVGVALRARSLPWPRPRSTAPPRPFTSVDTRTTGGSRSWVPPSGCPASTSASSSSRTPTRPGARSATPAARSSTLGGATAALLLATGFVFARSRRQAEASDRRQRSILDNTSAAVALKDRDGAYLVANQAWLRVLQRPESQVLGRRDEDVLPFDAASRRQALERQVLETGRPVETTEDWTVEGALRHFLTVIFPVRGEANELTGLGVISTDITTQVQSERRLEELSGNLERLVEERTAELAVAEERTRLILDSAVWRGSSARTRRGRSPS